MWLASIARVIAVDYRVATATPFAAFAMRSATARGWDT
jgi:acetyl esterase/lipase